MELTATTALASAMRKRGISFRELSYRTGIPIGTLHRAAAGTTPLRAPRLRAVARHLGVSMESLVDSDLSVAS